MVMETKAEAVDVRNGTTNGTTNGTLQGKASNNLNSNNVVMERSEPDGDCKPLGRGRAAYNQGTNAQYDFSVESDRIGTQTAKGPGAVCTSVVRRLTPLECERLQGFPDRWCDIGEWTDEKGVKHKLADSARYKAMGNSIARPWWKWLARRICAEYERPVTMGSLFDGVGGFPLCFAECGATPVWASEIEPFCIAVTKQRFGDDDKGTKGDWREFV